MIGHDTLTPEERAYQQECDAFLAEHLDPELVARMDRSEVLYPTEFIRMLGERFCQCTSPERQLGIAGGPFGRGPLGLIRPTHDRRSNALN